MNQGKLIVISAPSGSGKSTIAAAIMRKFPSLMFSVSATTRPKRSGETNGKEYFFLSREEFQERVKQGDLVEWEEIYGDFYGTLRSEIDKTLAAGRVMLFDVDVKGALSIKRAYPDAVLIFVKPPSFQELKERLQNRKTENEATLARRLERVPMELELGERCDYQIVNDDLPRAIDEVERIVKEHTQLDSIHTEHN